MNAPISSHATRSCAGANTSSAAHASGDRRRIVVVGEVVMGRYEVVSHLASGGQGRVCLARATGPGGFERHVVLKMLEVEPREDDPSVAMFLDEARVIGRMHHQHIAPAYEL